MSKITSTLLAAALFSALAVPALAQAGNPMASTQYPPSAGNSNEGAPQPLNSIPESAATAVRDRPGSDIGTTVTDAAVSNAASNAPDVPEG